MPRTTISQEARVGGAQVEKFPAIKLDKGERSRIFCPEEPWTEWTHRLEGPKVADGQPVMRTFQDKNGVDQSRYDMQWVSSPICPGDYGILADKGADPANCPACAVAMESGDIKAPEVRFAQNVLRYATRPGGWELLSPFSMTPIIWKYTAGRYDKLIDIKGIVGGDLTLVDLLLGPCEDAQYQKYDIRNDSQAVWRLVQGAGEYLAALWNNRASDEQLQAACGKRVANRAFLMEDVATVKRLWAQCRAAESSGAGGPAFGGPAFGGQQPLSPGMTGLLGDAQQAGQVAPPAQQFAPPAAPSLDVFGGGQQLQSQLGAPAAPQQFGPPAAPALDVFGGQPAAPVQPQQFAPQAPATPMEQQLAQHPGGMAEFAPAAPQGPFGAQPGQQFPGQVVPPNGGLAAAQQAQPAAHQAAVAAGAAMFAPQAAPAAPQQFAPQAQQPQAQAPVAAAPQQALQAPQPPAAPAAAPAVGQEASFDQIMNTFGQQPAAPAAG